MRSTETGIRVGPWIVALVMICAVVFLFAQDLWERDPSPLLSSPSIQPAVEDQQDQHRAAGTESSTTEHPGRTEAYASAKTAESGSDESEEDTGSSTVGPERSPWVATVTRNHEPDEKEKEACAGGLIVSLIPCASPRQAQLLEDARQALREQRAGEEDHWASR